MKCLKLLNEVTNEGDNIMHIAARTQTATAILNPAIRLKLLCIAEWASGFFFGESKVTPATIA